MTLVTIGDGRPIEKALAALPGATRTADGWAAPCPVCRAEIDGEPRPPSLRISEQSDGSVSIKCGAGCQPDAILAASGLTIGDLLLRISGGKPTVGSNGQHEDDRRLCLPRIYPIGALIDAHPNLHKPVVEGLIRAGETLNIISISKWGKTWLLHSLLLSIATGRLWLGRFPTRRGRVLIVDNELHKPTLAYRIKTVAEAMSIRREEYKDLLDTFPIRGMGLDIFGIGKHLEATGERYAMIVIDAKYRALPTGTNENLNSDEAQFYNEVDRLAETMGAAIALVHHSTKGTQGDKRVTDVGAGGGAQSRAADCHLILREHQNPGAAVLDAAVRSFEPIDPLALRWDFPLWVPDPDLDPDMLKGKLPQNEERQAQLDAESDNEILNVCTTWQTRGEIHRTTGFGESRINRAIVRLRKAGFLEQDKQDRPRNLDSEVFRKTIHAR